MDNASRSLAGSGQRRLLAKANKLLGQVLIENQPEPHTVLDDRLPADFIGVKGLRLPWGGR